jgi:hypothetical protein
MFLMSADAEQPPIDRRFGLLGAVSLSFLALILAEYGLRRHALIDPIPPALLAGSILVGAGIGTCAGVLMARLPSPPGDDFRMGIAIFFFPFLFAFGTAYQAYLAAELAHFYAYPVTRYEDNAKVIGMDRSRYGNRFAYVSLGPSLLDTQVRIDDAVYTKLDPWRAPGRDCLRVEVETGRNGVRRMVLPSAFDDPFGLGRLVPCAGRYPETESAR